MKRILVVECGAGFGGALTSLKSFLDGVSESEGWEFHVLTAYPQNHIRPGKAVKTVTVFPRYRLYGPNAFLERFLSRFLKKRAGNLSFFIDMMTTGTYYALKIAIYIRRNKIDLLHLNNGVLINDAALMGGRLAGVPCVVHERGPEYPGKISAIFAKMADYFLPVSQYIAGTLASLGVSDDHMTVVPEGLDADRFADTADAEKVLEELNFPVSCPVIIGMVACLVHWKGCEVFLEACARVLKNNDALIIIAGDTPDGSQDYKIKLEKKAHCLGIARHVHFLGHRDDVASIMAVCDIIIHASTSPEPFGRVILEAMSLSRPIVASDSGGPAEIIRDETSGILVPPGDADTMAEAINLLIGNKEMRDKMGVQGYKTVRSRYSISHHIRLIETCYNRFLNRC